MNFIRFYLLYLLIKIYNLHLFYIQKHHEYIVMLYPSFHYHLYRIHIYNLVNHGSMFELMI